MSNKSEISLGPSLKAARKAAKLSIEELSRRAEIAPKFIVALEAQNYHDLPGSPYIKCFIKSYCQALKINSRPFILLYNQETESSKTKNSLPELKHPIKIISKFHLLVAPKIIRNTIIVLILIICLGYLGRKIQAIVKPPTLTITSPKTDIITTQNTISITGITEPETNLTINGQKVIIQQDGKFNKQLFLQPGINNIKISAQKRHSAEVIEYCRVVVEEE